MKKALAILMGLALVACSAFAEVTIGAWGRGIFVPVYNTAPRSNNAQAFDTVSWGGTNPRVGISIVGKSDTAGFEIDPNWDGNSAGLSDQTMAWVKPFSMVKFTIGRAYEDALRGNACYGSWDWIRTSFTGEDSVFARMDTGYTRGQGFTVPGSDSAANNGFMMTLTPVEGLFIGANAFNVKNEKSAFIVRNSQYQVGYAIKNIGLVRAQYIGGYTYDNEKRDNGQFNAAFKYTGTDNLYIDIGYWIHTRYVDAHSYKSKAILFATYKINALTLSTSQLVAEKGYNKNGNKKWGYEGGLGANFALSNGFGLVGDIRYASDSATGVTGGSVCKDGNTSFLVGASKSVSNGKFSVGFQGCSNAFNRWSYDWSNTEANTASSAKFSWAVPVCVEFSF